MQKKIIHSCIFACFGITAEILFTGLKYNIVIPLLHQENIQWSLIGTSYVWMFFIYGSIPFIFPFIYSKINTLHVLLRAIVYAIICLSVEYITGFAIDKITGSCPWLYTEGIHLNGYIRLDYFPLWTLFGILTEKLWLYIAKSI